jgi:hypothetical protein
VNIDRESCEKRLFVIYFERKEQKYYLRSIDKDTNENIIYVKLSHNHPYAITRKHYFSMRQVVFSVNLLEDNDLHLNICCEPGLKNLEMGDIDTNDSSNKNNLKSFCFKTKDSPVTIGRQNCTINLNYSFLSKRHCVITFNSDTKSWDISDGHACRPSTNGTWLTLSSKFEISYDTDLKIGNNVIRINVVN